MLYNPNSEIILVQQRMEDMDVTIHFEKATYIWGIISWHTLLLLPVGVSRLTGSRMNVTLYLKWTRSPPLLWKISSLGGNFSKSVWVLFILYTMNERKYVLISPMMPTMCRQQQGQGPQGLSLTLKPSSVQQLCWPGHAALEVQDVPVMVVCLPAKTLTLADNPYPIHNDTRATFDSNNRNHPQSLDNCSLLVLAPSSLQFLIEGSC